MVCLVQPPILNYTAHIDTHARKRKKKKRLIRMRFDISWCVRVYVTPQFLAGYA